MNEVDARVRAMIAEVGLPAAGSEELVRWLTGLEERYVDDSPPEPGRELTALLDRGDGTAPRHDASGSRRRRAAAAGVVAIGLVVSTGWAAAANELPTPAQRWVAQLSQRYLPFQLPYPDAGVRGGGTPGGSSDDTTRSQSGDEHDSGTSPGEGRGLSTTEPSRRHGQLPYEADEPAGGAGEVELNSEVGSETGVQDEREPESRETNEDRSGSEESVSVAPDGEGEQTDSSYTTGARESGDGYGGSASDGAEDGAHD